MNKDNRTETAFNAVIGIILSGALFVMAFKLLRENKRIMKFQERRTQSNMKSLI